MKEHLTANPIQSSSEGCPWPTLWSASNYRKKVKFPCGDSVQPIPLYKWNIPNRIILPEKNEWRQPVTRKSVNLDQSRNEVLLGRDKNCLSSSDCSNRCAQRCQIDRTLLISIGLLITSDVVDRQQQHTDKQWRWWCGGHHDSRRKWMEWPTVPIGSRTQIIETWSTSDNDNDDIVDSQQ